MWAISQILFSSFDKRLASYLEDERRRSGSAVITATHDQIAKNLGSAREVVSPDAQIFRAGRDSSPSPAGPSPSPT